jgi:hypothetical protein
MSHKTKWIIADVLAFIVIALSCLYFIPKTTPIDITLDAVKTDSSDENNLGTVQLHIHGTLYEYLLRSDELEFSIDDFDHLYDIRRWGQHEADGAYPNIEIDLGSEGYTSTAFQASSTVTGEDSAMIILYLRNDLKDWNLVISPHILFPHKEAAADPSLHLNYRATLE